MTKQLLENTWRKEYPKKKCEDCGKLLKREKYQLASHWLQQRWCKPFGCKTKEEDKLNHGLARLLTIRKCETCERDFKPLSHNQRFCGGKFQVGTCSYKHRILSANRDRANRKHKGGGTIVVNYFKSN